MTNEEQFREDMKLAGFDRVKRERKGVKRIMVKLEKFSKLMDVGAATLCQVNYEWVSENCVYAYPINPDAEYAPAYHVIKYVVCQYKNKHLHTIVHCSTAKQVNFLMGLLAKDGTPKKAPAEHVRKINKASTYKLVFYSGEEKVCVVYVSNKQIGKYLASLWDGKTKLQKKLSPVGDYEFPAPPISVCTPF